MKTMCTLMGLLLLLGSCCCLGIPKAVDISTSPRTCCYNVSQLILRPERVVTINMTHKSCPTKAFIVKTVTGKRICYNMTFDWALNLYKSRHGNQQ